MKKTIIIILAAALAAVSCSKVNELDKRVGDLEKRVDAIETTISQINTNISSIREIITALQANDYISEIKDIKDAAGKVIGYELIFTKKGSVKIYHGTDGQQGAQGPIGPQGPTGATPQIGIAKDATDGLYYWTLNGSWLLASDGSKVLAVGRDGTNGSDGTPGAQGTPGQAGNDGVTPRLKIEQGNWYVWYNETDGWVLLGVATGVTTSEFFSSVYQEGDDLVLNLADGTTYRIPIGSTLSIAYNVADTVVVQLGETRTVHYVITSSAGAADIEVLTSSDIKAKLANQQGLEGDIEIVIGNEITEYSKLVVLVTDGNRIIMDRFGFETEGLTTMNITDNTNREVAATAGDLELEFLTNTDAKVVIPAAAQSWISASEITTKSLTPHAVTLHIQENTGVSRSAVVTIQSKISNVHLDYTIFQKGVLSVFKFTHTRVNFTDSFPTVVGADASAVIDWGDAVTNAWGTYTHNYTDGAKSHTVSVTAANISQIGIALTGVTAIDVSEL